MAKQADIARTLAELRAIMDRLDTTGSVGRALSIEPVPDGHGTTVWELTMRSVDMDPRARGELVTVLGQTKGQVSEALRMMFEGATLAVMAAAVDVQRKAGVL